MIAVVAYDEELAERVREALSGHDALTEKRMFGGLGFMLAGHMAVAAGSDGGLLLRCDPDETAGHARADGVEPMVMRGRPMTGWLSIAPEAVVDDAALERWVAIGTAFVATLPPK